MPSETISGTLQVQKILYPKVYQPGEWSIFSATIYALREGEPIDEKELHFKGRTYSLDIGALYSFEAVLVYHEKYGYSYNLISFAKDVAVNDEASKKMFLSSIFTKNQISLFYDNLKDPFDTLLQKDVTSLRKIKGIGDRKAISFVDRFHSEYIQAQAYIALGKYGFSQPTIDTLIRKFDGDIDRMLHVIDENPYTLMYCVSGIGWKKADQIALRKGIAPDSRLRIEANIFYQLQSASEKGHTWLSPENLITNCLADLNLSTKTLGVFKEALHSLHEQKKVWWDEDKTKIALYRLRHIEEQIAEELFRLKSSTPLPIKTSEKENHISENECLSLRIMEMEKEQGWDYTQEQVSAIRTALKSNVSIITGSAGTGKSSVVSGILKVFKGYEFIQCALSGRAAARLSEVTKKEGSTIHRLLMSSSPKARSAIMGNPDDILAASDQDQSSWRIPYDIIILDEVSMVGAEIFLALIKAIPSGSKLIMLGDLGQLESIGLCNIFKDMLSSNEIPTTRLTQIHRQAARSAIVTESMNVHNGRSLLPYTEWQGTEVRGEMQDLRLVAYSNPLISQSLIVEQYKSLINEGIPYTDIQVIVPMRYRGNISTYAINNIIQQTVNPALVRQGVQVKQSMDGGNDVSYIIRPGDRVIATKNMYKSIRYIPGKEDMYLDQYAKELLSENDYVAVYNGDRGIVKQANEKYIVVCFEQYGEVFFPHGKFQNIELGYALTCHKLQGSETRYVIVGLDFSAITLLTREWLYTAITRASKYCILCGQNKAIEHAVGHSNISVKQTMLEDLIKQAFSNSFTGGLTP